MTPKNRLLTLALVALSLALLVPGITRPFFTLDGSLDKSKVADTAIEIIVDSMVAKQDPPPTGAEIDAARARSRGSVTQMMSMMGIEDPTGELDAYTKTRSILGTVKELYETGNPFVAFLVVLFSVIIPVTKILLLLLAAFALKPAAGSTTLKVTGIMSKWSMADVFVVAILVAFLASNAKNDLEDLVILRATLHSGFYFFLAYCIFSIASTYLLKPSQK